MTEIKNRDGDSAGDACCSMLDDGERGQEASSGSKRPSLLCPGVRGLGGGF